MAAEIFDETESGTGRIRQNGIVVVNPVEYAIAYSHRMIPAPTPQQPDARLRSVYRVEGQLRSLFPLTLVGSAIELELEDGRRWKCWLQSSRGDLIDAGDLISSVDPTE